MKTLAFLIDVICTFHEAFWLYYMIDAVFERRKHWRININNKWMRLGISIVCTTMLILAFNQIVLTSSFTVVVVSIASVIFTCLFWKSNILNAIAIIGAYYFAMYLAASLEFWVVGMIGGEELIQQATMEQKGVRVVFILICGVIWLFLNLVFYRWLKGIRIDKNSEKYIFFISVTGLIGGSFIVGQMPYYFNSYIYIMWCFFLIAVMACIYGTYFLIKKKELQMRLRITSAQNDMLEQNYERMNEFYKANAKLYHDLNHHLSAIYHMLEKGNQEQAKQYIESLREPLNLPPVPIRTSLDMVDVILYEMDKKAERKGVLMIVDAQRMPSDITIEKKDLCALFANLLDNAVEAAGREIRMQIRPIHQMLFIQIENDFVTEPVKQNGRFRTTKKNPDSHGWGMQIIEQIVSKYEGSIEYEVKEGSFCVNAMINMFMR